MDNRIMAVLAVVLLVVGFAGGYFVGLQSAVEVAPAEPKLTGTIPIGVVMIGSIAPRELPPLEEWLETEVNDYLANLGYEFEIDLLYENAERSSDLALEKVQLLHSQGAKIILGMRWSSSIQKSYDYVNENKIVVISEGSTSPLLAVPDDYVFRLPPNDLKQSRAIIALHRDLGTEAVVLLYRGDAWGDGLRDEFTRLAEDEGITVFDEVRYSPEATEFSGEVATLANLVSQALEQYDRVAVQTFVFDEVATILQSAADYEVLMNVPWIGSDGQVGVDVVVQDAGEQAFLTVQLSTIFAPAESLKHKAFVEKYIDLTGFEPGTYTKAFYDSVWIAALSIAHAGEYDGEKIKDVVPLVANNFFGVTGWTKLDENGDREAAVYNMEFVVETSPGVYEWVFAGTIDVLSGQITWDNKPDFSRFGW